MGFWDKMGELAGNAVKAGMDKAKEQNNKYNETIARAEDWDDDRLIRRFKEEKNTVKKMAYAKILKDRGYGKQD